MAELRRTPLHDVHVASGAKMVPFAGFSMPVHYAEGIHHEHEVVRSAAGLFDVSHMGEFLVSGPQAEAFVSRATTNDPARLEPGQAQYSVLCLPDGGIVDDLLVYRLGAERFRLVVNAANVAKDLDHLSRLAVDHEVRLEDESERIALIAIQGPRAQEILSGVVPDPLDPVGFYEFITSQVAGVPAVVSRTGYTGEDGFELYLPADRSVPVWEALREQGEPLGLEPAGLGARDTLRLEMGYALYGNDIDEETSPLEAGLGWLVKLDKEGGFVGREALARQKEEGVGRRLRGFRLTERGFPRPGYEVVLRGEVVGPVRSGTQSPSLGEGIGTAYLPPDAEAGERLAIRIRGRDVAGEVARMPFWRDGSIRK